MALSTMNVETGTQFTTAAGKPSGCVLDRLLSPPGAASHSLHRMRIFISADQQFPYCLSYPRLGGPQYCFVILLIVQFLLGSIVAPLQPMTSSAGPQLRILPSTAFFSTTFPSTIRAIILRVNQPIPLAGLRCHCLPVFESTYPCRASLRTEPLRLRYRMLSSK